MAIEYGYTLLDTATPEEELPALHAIAARTNEPGLPYGTDEEADNYDPNIQRFDLSNDPLAYTDATFALNRTLMQSLAARQPKPGESYRQFTVNFLALLRSQQRTATQVLLYLGGLHLERNHRGDPRQQPPLSRVSTARQDRALRQLTANLFSTNFLAIPPDYYNNLSGDPYAVTDTLAEAGFPMRQTLGNIRKTILQSLFDNKRLARIATAEFIAPADAFRMSELFTAVRAAVWAQLAI